MASASPASQPTTGAPASTTVRKETGQAESSDPLKTTVNDSPATNAVNATKLTSSPSASNVGSLRIKPPQSVPTSEPVTPVNFEFPASVKTAGKIESPTTAQAQSSLANGTPQTPIAETVTEDDAFDVRETVNVLTLQFLSDHAETRIAALEWLLMLHLKAPQKVGPAGKRVSTTKLTNYSQIISRDSSTFPALLKTLSDPSEDVSPSDILRYLS